MQYVKKQNVYIGQKYDKLTVISLNGIKKYPSRNTENIWHCKCECGNEINILERSLLKDCHHSCGCSKLNDLTGKKFGRLTVLSRSNNNTNDKKPKWICCCDCGNLTEVAGNSLISGRTKSCGCLKAETSHIILKTHGGSTKNNKEKLYTIWSDIKQRCYNKNSPAYPYYGGRGITMDNIWYSSYSAFREWALNNGYDPTARRPDCTIDRIDVNGNYCPENCRWVSMKIQGNNTRKNRVLSLGDETHTVSEWSDILHINSKTIMARLNLGWSVEDALTIPVNTFKRYKEKTE